MFNGISLVNLLDNKEYILRNADKYALEATDSSVELSKSEDPDTPMKVALIGDRLIMKSKLKPVSDPISHSSGGIPTPGGLFSYEIFGLTADERRRQFAYIDLHESFFHPFVYEILMALMPKKFDKCASGNGSWKIEDGELIEIKDKNSKEYNEDNSGILWLKENYKKLKIKETGSMTRSDRIRLLKDLSDEDIFITKWLVVPIVYRDIDKNSSIHKLPELNQYYNNIIRYANGLKESSFGYFDNQLRYNLQHELIIIRRYGQSLIEKKNGFFHKAILGKSIDRGSGDVISTPSMRGYEKPSDNPVDVIHSGIPLAKCLIMGYDFIMRYCLNFFADHFKELSEYPVYKKVDGKWQITGKVDIQDVVERYSAKEIKKKINRFKNSHATRFDPITIMTKDGREIPIFLLGTYDYDNFNGLVEPLRPMTWTDLFYLAAQNTVGDKYAYITRYPVESHNHIFPSRVFVLSTLKTVKAWIYDDYYEHYPSIDFNIPSDRVSSCFNDTITLSNMCIEAMGADYDGDTVRSKICFSIEANEEAKKISESIKNFVSPEGELIRTLAHESSLCFYNMTKEKPVGKRLSDEQKRELLSVKKEDLTVKKISQLFGYTTSSKKDKQSVFEVTKPKFNPTDTFILEANEYINTERIETNVGKFLFNKLFFEGNNIGKLVPNGYNNTILTAKNFKKIDSMVANGAMDRKIEIVPDLLNYVRDVEFWGLGLVSIFGTSYTLDTIVPNKELAGKKEKILKEAKAKGGSLANYTEAQDKILDIVSNETKNSTGRFLFDSGARGSYENDFKNMMVTVGAIENPITGKHDFMTSSYIDGIKKEDLPAAANSVVNAEYPKAIGTASGGYMTKQFYAVFQNMILGEDGSDCKSKGGLNIFLDKDNLGLYIDQYLMDDNGKPLLITEDIDPKYLNRNVIIRSPMYCLDDKPCSICMGRRFYKLEIDNIGLVTSALSGAIQRASLKLRHSLLIKMNKIDEDKLLID